MDIFTTIVFLISTLIIYVFYLNFCKRQEIIEGFYTLFLPYYNPSVIKKFQVYSPTFRQKLNKINLTFLISQQQLQYTYFKLFLKSLIAYNYPVINIQLLAENNHDRAIPEKINNYSDDLGVVPAPILYHTYIKINQEDDKKNREKGSLTINENGNNLRFVTSLNEQYIFVITTNQFQTNLLKELDGKILGRGMVNSLWDQIASDIENMANIKTKPFYGTLRTMLEKLINGGIDAIVITDSFPGNIINYIFYNTSNLKLLSFQNLNHIDFYYNSTTIDLNKLPTKYLPMMYPNHHKFEKATLFNNTPTIKNRYTFFNSSFITLKFINYLITNDKTSDEAIYIVTKHTFNNNLMLNKSKKAFSLIPIPFHPGAKKYYIEKGYISYLPYDNCIYLYGKGKCTEKNMKDKLLDYDIYYNLL